MAAKIIVSYDGTDSDHDALAFGRLLSRAGASLELAYVRHAKEIEQGQEKLAEHEAQRLLEGGAQWLGQPGVPQHVVISGSTPEGLRDLAAQIGADAVVFGSEYRTTPGHVDPGTSARRLMEGGPVAVGIGPAELRYRPDAPIRTIAAIVEDDDPSVADTAQALATRLGSSIATKVNGGVDMIVAGSKPGTTPGTVLISAAVQYLIELSRCPVLVLARGVAIPF